MDFVPPPPEELLGVCQNSLQSTRAILDSYMNYPAFRCDVGLVQSDGVDMVTDYTTCTVENPCVYSGTQCKSIVVPEPGFHILLAIGVLGLAILGSRLWTRR